MATSRIVQEVEGENSDDNDDSDLEDDDDTDLDEPILKYLKLTDSLAGVYRNGDATSASLVTGDKMVVGTHNGNIHIYSLPSLRPLRVYHAHSASVTALSVSPYSSLRRIEASEAVEASPASELLSIRSKPSRARGTPSQPVPHTPSNLIHVASSSIDGNVCIAALADTKDVHIRNFGRPLHGIALSPQFRVDRTYVSGGSAGKLVLTVGGRSSTGSAQSLIGSPASSVGWLSSLGLGSRDAKDTVLHSGEGSISTIEWSLTGKYVIWVNERGIKIMRSNIALDSSDLELAWKRIGHIDRPTSPKWEEMCNAWKCRVEWASASLSHNDDGVTTETRDGSLKAPSDVHSAQTSLEIVSRLTRPEKVYIGWGSTVWIVHVHPGGAGRGNEIGERILARAEIVQIKRFDDCIISGLSLLSSNSLVVLAYLAQSDTVRKNSADEDPAAMKFRRSPGHGREHRQMALKPELRLIDLSLPDEDAVVSADSLNILHFESLSSSDYHIGVVCADQAQEAHPGTRGRFEELGAELLTAGLRATKVFSSGASVRSADGTLGTVGSSQGLRTSNSSTNENSDDRDWVASQVAAGPGPKIFIHSPYDCIIAIRRDCHDHLAWLLEHEKFGEAWELVNRNPALVSSSVSSLASVTFTPQKVSSTGGPSQGEETPLMPSTVRPPFSAVEKDKRMIGEEWIKQCIKNGDWRGAGEVCGKVLGTSSRWEHWVWVFAQAQKFEEITPYIPAAQLQPPLPSLVYEYVLGHYIVHDRVKLREVLALWPPELFNVQTVIDAIKAKLETGEIREDTVEHGEVGRDWRILTEALGKLYVTDSRPREALGYYMRLKDADSVMKLIKDYSLPDAILDDIAGFIQLRLTATKVRTATVHDIEETTAEAISLLVSETYHGTVQPAMVVKQLEAQSLTLLLFFYLRELWRAESRANNHLYPNTHHGGDGSLLDEFADTAVRLFAEYDRALLLEFLKQSQSYGFEAACEVCDRRGFILELVYLLSKTGESKRALFLIIDKLANVSQAISFAKSQDDADLWNDLLDYSMDKPQFIRALLEEVGTAINSVQLVHRIPEGLEIEGLKSGLSRILKEYELQYSISEGVARILRGEVAFAMETLRVGQVRGIKFDIGRPLHVPNDQTVEAEEAHRLIPTGQTVRSHHLASGACERCGKPLTVSESEPLVGFRCGHVFHLSCLLEQQIGATASQDGMDPNLLDAHESSSSHRDVSAKVARARIIREKILDGCPAPAHAEGQTSS